MGISDSDGFPQIRHFLLWVFLTAFMDISDLRLNPSLPFMSTFLSNDYGFQPEIWHFLTCLEHLSNVAGIRHFRWWGSSVMSTSLYFFVGRLDVAGPGRGIMGKNNKKKCKKQAEGRG